jgi:catechol 2,3-dioxygenase-like lactoylglutathione lyase family enzyme
MQKIGAMYSSVNLLNRSMRRSLGWALIAASVTFTGSLSAQTPERPEITGISHIAVFAHNFEKSRAFYGEFLGLEQPYTLKNPDGSLSMTFFKINDRQYIELFPEKEADTDRLSHISLETTDAEALRKYLVSKGVKVPPQVHKARIGTFNFNFTDPAGHTIEIVQYTPDSLPVKAAGKFMSDKAISNKMTHVGLIVTDLQPEYDFYTKVLGFTETWRGSHDGKVLSWINLKLPNGTDYLEFMLYKDEPEPTKRGGAHHLCLQVPSVPDAVAKLEANPYYKTYGRTIEIHLGTNHKRQANLYDPDGTRTELMEPNTIDDKPTPSSSAPPQ